MNCASVLLVAAFSLGLAVAQSGEGITGSGSGVWNPAEVRVVFMVTNDSSEQIGVSSSAPSELCRAVQLASDDVNNRSGSNAIYDLLQVECAYIQVHYKLNSM